MTAKNRKKPEGEPVPTERGSEDQEEAGKEAAGEILSPAMPGVGGGVMLDVDPRLNELSETEAELRQLVEENDEAERESKGDSDATDEEAR